MKKSNRRKHRKPLVHRPQVSTVTDVSSRMRRWRWGVSVLGVASVGTLVFFLIHPAPKPQESAVSEPVTNLVDPTTVPTAEHSAWEDLAGPAADMHQIKVEELRMAQRIKTLFPRDVRSWVLLGNVYYQHGDVPAGMAVWTQGLAVNPRHVPLYLRLGIVAADLGELDKALAYWHQGLEIDARSPELRWHMADMYISQGKHTEAAELLEQECALVPNAARTYFRLGQTYLQLRQYEQARVKFEKTLALAPDHFNACYGLGTVYQRLKDPARAKTYLERFQALKKASLTKPENRIALDEVPDARLRMARRYMEAHAILPKTYSPAAAEALLKRALQLDPDNTNYLEKLGVYYYTQRHLPEALQTFEQARITDPNKPLFYFNIGKICVAQQRIDQAEQTLLDAINRFPTNAMAYAELARFYVQTGRNPTQALASAQRAVELAPANQTYRMLYEQLKKQR